MEKKISLGLCFVMLLVVMAFTMMYLEGKRVQETRTTEQNDMEAFFVVMEANHEKSSFTTIITLKNFGDFVAKAREFSISQVFYGRVLIDMALVFPYTNGYWFETNGMIYLHPSY